MRETQTTLQHVKGLAELHTALQQIPVELETKVMTGALRAGAKVIQAAAQAEAPSASGALRGSIRVKMLTKIGGEARWRLRAQILAGNKDAYYAHMIEGGTQPHLIAASARVQRQTRKGMKDVSLRKMTSMIETGTLQTRSRGGSKVLVIGGNFVGTAVMHPGIKANDFMHRAFASSSDAAISAVAAFAARRIAAMTKNGTIPGGDT
jgi:HK97 gp10 family phage protein